MIGNHVGISITLVALIEWVGLVLLLIVYEGIYPECVVFRIFHVVAV